MAARAARGNRFHAGRCLLADIQPPLPVTPPSPIAEVDDNVRAGEPERPAVGSAAANSAARWRAGRVAYRFGGASRVQ
jgi:hypothetical protein